jgi:hypothetical protein
MLRPDRLTVSRAPVGGNGRDLVVRFQRLLREGQPARGTSRLTPIMRDEHRRALDWLNERTDEQVDFFGVELDVVKIGVSFRS